MGRHRCCRRAQRFDEWQWEIWAAGNRGSRIAAALVNQQTPHGCKVPKTGKSQGGQLVDPKGRRGSHSLNSNQRRGRNLTVRSQTMTCAKWVVVRATNSCHDIVVELEYRI